MTIDVILSFFGKKSIISIDLFPYWFRRENGEIRDGIALVWIAGVPERYPGNPAKRFRPNIVPEAAGIQYGNRSNNACGYEWIVVR